MWSNLPNFNGVFYLAMFGVVCAVLLAIGAIGAVAWFALNHVRII